MRKRLWALLNSLKVGRRETRGPGLYSYSQVGAMSYDSLGIEGTTYAIGFDAVRMLLGDIRDLTFVDFGSGTGRSAQFLLSCGAAFVYGVDHDTNMISTARAKDLPNCEFLEAESSIPLPDESVDGAISLSVFIELRTIEQMSAVCQDIARVVKPGGIVVIQSTSPTAFGHTFRNFSYTKPSGGSGSTAICRVTGPAGSLEIEDTYWSEDDYRRALAESGLQVSRIAYPLPEESEQWETDERTVAPFIVIKATKPQGKR